MPSTEEQNANQTHPDILEFRIPTGGKWISNSITRDKRRIVLYNIGVHVEFVETVMSASPEIPCLAPLLDLLQTNPELHEVRWDEINKVWNPITY
jgi:hypothetical protein